MCQSVPVPVAKPNIAQLTDQEIQDLISQVAVLQFEDTMHGYTACAHLERDAQLLRFNIYRSAMASIKTEPLFHG